MMGHYEKSKKRGNSGFVEEKFYLALNGVSLPTVWSQKLVCFVLRIAVKVFLKDDRIL